MRSRTPRPVTRPSVPPVLWMALALWGGIVIAEWVCWAYGAAVMTPLFWGCACAVVAVACYAGRRQGYTGVLVVVVGVLAGGGVGACRWAVYENATDRMCAAGPLTVVVDTLDDGTTRDGRTVSRVGVADGPGRGLRLQAVWPSGSAVRAGHRYRLRGIVQPADAGSRWARVEHMSCVSGRVRVWSVEDVGVSPGLRGVCSAQRDRIAAITAGMQGPGALLLDGVLLGDRRRLRESTVERDFRTTGLSHLLAVSGSHLAAVAWLVGGALARTRMRRSLRVALVLVASVAYVGISGMQVSALRSLVMLGVAGAAGGAGRRVDALAALGVAVAGLLLLRPEQAFELGFVLSVFAVGGLALFAPLAAAWVGALHTSRRLRFIGDGIAASVVAQAATAPVTIAAFNAVPLIGPIANVIAAPLVTAGLGAGIVGGALSVASESLARRVLLAAQVPLSLAAQAASRLAEVPHASVLLGGSAPIWAAGALLSVAALWLFWPQPRCRRHAIGVIGVFSLVVSLCLLPPVGHSGPEIVFLDVGQGDAILVRDGTAAILIDTGPSSRVLRSALARLRVTRLDAVLLTHMHADHTGGLGGLAGVVPVGRVFLTPLADEEGRAGLASALDGLTGVSVSDLPAGSVVTVGRFAVHVLWPGPDDRASDTNDTSTIVRIADGGFSAILTGDAEQEPQRELAARGLLGDIDVLKAPHHGSAEGIDASALAILKPELCVISAGAGNGYGHPAPSTMSQLRHAGVATLRTDERGDIRVIVGRDGYSVRCTETPRSDPGVALRSRGDSHRPCATMQSTSARRPRPLLAWSEPNGLRRLGRPQTGLSHLRSRGPPSRAGAHPSQAPVLRGRGR